MFKLIIILILTLYSSAFSAEPNGFTPEQIRKDFEAQQSDKYRSDNLETAQPQKLISSQIVKPEFTTTVENTTTVDCNSFMSQGWTSSIYQIDAVSGMAKCVYSQVDNLYEPQGLFAVFYPQLKAKFAQNTELAKQQNAAIIIKKDQMTQSLIDTKNTISKSIQEAQGTYVNTTKLIMAGVLADSQIINPRATETTGKLQLQGDFTSQYTSSEGVTDSGYIIKGEIVNIFKNYSAISSEMIDYLFLIIIFIAVFTAGRILLAKLNKHDSTVSPWSFGVFAFIGLVAFLPSSTSSGNAPQQNTKDEFVIISSNFQDLSKQGYYLFGNLADNLAKKITDNTLETLINKSGIGTSQQIVDSASSMAQAQKLIEYHTSLKSRCTNSYDIDYLVKEFGTANSPYPQSEKWAYAISVYQPTAGKNYYNKSPEGLVKAGAYSSSAAANEGSYPQLSFSFCHRNDNLLAKYEAQHKDYTSAYNAAIGTDSQSDVKLQILNTLINFQYKLYRQWGFLSILGLPVIEMQTKAEGNIYQKDNVTKKLQERIGNTDGSSSFLNSFISSIPYMLVPGAATLYGNTISTIRDLSSGASDTLVGKALGLFGGNVVASVASNTAAFTLSYMLMKALLVLLPIAGTIIIGLLRFLIIIFKIFAFNFASLLLFPLILTQNNGEHMSKFTIKILLLMLELPAFVISVWLAITASSLLHSIGDVFSKEIIIGMLENNTAGVAKEWSISSLLSMPGAFIDALQIYLLNGFMEVAISLFSIIIIYKLIISFHTALFDGLELKGTSILDDSISSLRNEANMGGKI